jgi:hypothetical protein
VLSLDGIALFGGIAVVPAAATAESRSPPLSCLAALRRKGMGQLVSTFRSIPRAIAT